MKLEIQKLIEQAVSAAFPELKNLEITLEYPAQKAHGDYACNIAMRLSKQLGQNPRQIADQILSKIPKSDLISKVEIAGPGFINIRLSDQAYNQEVDRVLKQGDKYGQTDSGKGQKIICEYSAPNIAKPLGVHHLLSTAIGQSLANIYKSLSYQVTTWNYFGDWGTQFGKLIVAYRKWGDQKVIEKDPIHELQKLYVKFHDEAEKDESLEDEGRAEFKKLEDGDAENRKLWEWIREISKEEVGQTYQKLGGIHFDIDYGEAHYEDMLSEILKEGIDLGVFVEGKEGALIVEYDDKDMPPFVVKKKDDATLYSTRDFALMKDRVTNYKPDKIILVVDIAQTLHFKQLFAACERFPWYHGEAVHVWFGRMHMKDGKASTRKGNVVWLDQVLDEAIERAAKIVEEKNPDIAGKEKVAHTIGIGAVKYNILSQNRTTDITFDWDRMLSLDGNSAPYLQYSYARARSILRKSAQSDAPTDTIRDPQDAAEKTRNLLMIFSRFSQQIEFAAQEYKPNIIANYLYELAQEFNAFYNSVPVLKASQDKELRLQIVDATSQILKNGLALLGIDVLEEM